MFFHFTPGTIDGFGPWWWWRGGVSVVFFSGEFRGVQGSSWEFRWAHRSSREFMWAQMSSLRKKTSTHHKILSDQVWKPWCYPTLICVYFFNCKQVGALQPKALIPWAIQPWPQFVYFFFNCRQVGAPQPKAYTVKPLGHITLISIYFVIGSRAHTMNSLGYPAHTPKYILIHRLGLSSLVLILWTPWAIQPTSQKTFWFTGWGSPA